MLSPPPRASVSTRLDANELQGSFDSATAFPNAPLKVLVVTGEFTEDNGGGSLRVSGSERLKGDDEGPPWLGKARRGSWQEASDR